MENTESTTPEVSLKQMLLRTVVTTVITTAVAHVAGALVQKGFVKLAEKKVQETTETTK